MPDDPEDAWVDAFVAYVVGLRPDLLSSRVSAAGASLYARFGEFDPGEVAEAEWGYMGLGE